jgi:hypothetical protein
MHRKGIEAKMALFTFRSFELLLQCLEFGLRPVKLILQGCERGGGFSRDYNRERRRKRMLWRRMEELIFAGIIYNIKLETLHT